MSRKKAAPAALRSKQEPHRLVERGREKEAIRELRRARRRRHMVRGLIFSGFLTLVCLAGLAVTLILGQPYPWTVVQDSTEAIRIARHLEGAQSRWESLAVHHYEIKVAYQRGETYCGPARLVVQAGQVVQAPDPRESHWFPPETCDALLASLTVEGAFSWLRSELDSFAPAQTYLRASFDPDFGYVTRIEAGIYRSEDLGCCWVVTWTNMSPLPDE